MRTALITPLADLDSFPHEDRIHLTLAHLIGPTNKYTTFYVKKKIAGDYIIIDNSAHEFRKPMPPAMLLRRAIVVRADEVVMPDVPYKGPETVMLTDEALKMWTKYMRVELEELRPQLMLVPQGSSLAEWRTCLFALILKWQRATKEYSALFRKQPRVSGLLAKYQDKVPGADSGQMIRDWLRPLHDNGYPIHLLGWRELWR